jgi:branched-chain amino acid transport system permease protein
MEQQIYQLVSLISIYSLIILSMNVLIGYLGILHLGHVGFYSIGAYTLAILTTTYELSFGASLLIGGLFAMISGLILSLPALRLKSHFIGITTFGFFIAINNFIISERDITGGARGILDVPRPDISYFGDKNLDFMITILIITIIISIIMHKILRSPFSRLVEAIRDDETATKTLGKPTKRTKIKAFLLSSFVAGIAGGLLASYFQFISPKNFSMEELILVLTMVIVGGLASFWGSFVGAALILLIPEALRMLLTECNGSFFTEGCVPQGTIGAIRFLTYGALIIMFMLFRPNGILGRRNNNTK